MNDVGVRFWSKVEKTETCWTWVAGRSNGYGSFRDRDGAVRPAHRVAYEMLIEPVPSGLVLDHLCRNCLCVNPVHLEPVTHLENVRRGQAGERNYWRRHCVAGHEFSAENTHIRKNGSRYCRACALAREKRAGHHGRKMSCNTGHARAVHDGCQDT